MEPAISASGMTRRFGKVTALEAVTFSVERGAVMGLLGHNGAGKTTTIRILNGLLRANSGEARVLGMDPSSDGARIRARTGVLTETPSLDERLTARENLAFSARMFGLESGRAKRRVAELLERFDLTDRGPDRVSGFSRGMKQRLALARALLHEPELLFLDEPTAALDPVAARAVHDLIRALAGASDRTVVISTHNLVEAQRLCDRVVILRDGRLVATGAPHELVRRLGRVARLEIEVEPAQREAALTAIGGDGLNVAPRNESVVAIDGVAREQVPRIVAELAKAGIAIYRVSADEPTLEDVYFSLYEHQADTPAVEVKR